MTKESSNKFRFFSFIFALVVIGYHARLPFLEEYDLVNSVTPFISRMYDHLCSIAMSFFFMTSGYMLYNGASIENAGKKFSRRIQSLLIPYMLWNLIYLGFFLVFRPDYFKDGIVTIIYGFTVTPFNGAFWYIFVIFCLSVFVIPIVLLHKVQPTVLRILFVLLMILSMTVGGCSLFSSLGFSEDDVIISWIVRFFRYLPAYMIGSYMGLTHSDCVDYSLSGKFKLFFSFFFVLMTLFMILLPDIPTLLKQVNLTVQPIILWLIVDNRYFVKQNNRIQGSFLMYAIHPMIIMVPRYIIGKMFPSNIDGVLALALWLSFPFIIMYVTYETSRVLGLILSKFHLRRLENALTGGRK